jgi:hypothetical protein
MFPDKRIIHKFLGWESHLPVIFLKNQLILKIEAYPVHILRRVCNCAKCSSEKNTPSAPVDLSLFFVSCDETSGKLVAELIETMPGCLMNFRVDSSQGTELRVIGKSIWSSAPVVAENS